MIGKVQTSGSVFRLFDRPEVVRVWQEEQVEAWRCHLNLLTVEFFCLKRLKEII